MSKNIELINELISEATAMSYTNGKLDEVIRTANIVIRKIFGEKSPYLNYLRAIRFTPFSMISDLVSGKIEYPGEGDFINGKNQLLNLLKVAAKEAQLDMDNNKPKNLNIQNKTTESKKIFIVPGHNEEMTLSVARTIEQLGLKSIILREQPNKEQTIIEKFTENSDVAFAVVLLSADDLAYSKKDQPEKAQFRARQNVIFELGYFIGKIGREKVLALYEDIDNFETPSDYSGVVFVKFNNSGNWRYELVRELRALKIDVDANKIV